MIFCSAVEPSADMVLASIIPHLLKKTSVYGVGDQSFSNHGLTPLFSATELSVMGLVEVIHKIPLALKHMKNMVEYVMDLNIGHVFTIDGPSFHLPFIKKLKKYNKNIFCTHYVAPTVWAWRPKRARDFASIFDHLLTLFAFEVPYFVKEGLKTTFVGHPMIETLPEWTENQNYPKDLVLVLPGSRVSEIKTLLPIFTKTLGSFPKNTSYGCFTLPHLKSTIEAMLKDNPYNIRIVDSAAEKMTMLKHAKKAMIASGTLSLELGIMGIPHAIAYRIHPLSYFFAKRMVKLDHVALPNILTTPYVPECLQDFCTHSIISKAMDSLDQCDNIFKERAFALRRLLKPENTWPTEKIADILTKPFS